MGIYPQALNPSVSSSSLTTAAVAAVSCPSSIVEQESWVHENYSNGKFSIRFSEVFGRYLVAEKDFEAQELIIDEWPIVIAPSGHYDLDQSTERPLPVCIGCLQSSSSSSSPAFTKCPQCSWPICERSCVGLQKFHTQEECALFKDRGICQSPRSLRLVYLIRACLMSQHNPENWTKLLQLASESMKTETEAETNSQSQPQTINTSHIRERDRLDFKFIREVCQLDYIDEDLVVRINGVKRVNGFGFTNSPNSNTNTNSKNNNGLDETEEKDNVRYYGMAVYFLASMASHGCSPNLTTQVDYDPLENFPMRFRTKSRVKKGQVLQIAYTSRWLVLGTLRRREKIYKDYKFMCGCSRCGDATEGQTYFSALVCRQCKTGNLLPEHPMDPNSVWKCDGDQCLNVMEEESVTNVIERINGEIESVLESPTMSSPMKFEHLSNILAANSAARILHRNHYLILRAETEWLLRFPFQSLIHNKKSSSSENSVSQLEVLRAWNLFIHLVDRGEHCKRVYTQIIPDWLENNFFVDIALGQAYLNYYLNPDYEDHFTHDLSLDLMKITAKYFQDGLRNMDPVSEPGPAQLVMASCRSLHLRIENLIRSANKKLIVSCKEYDLSECA